MPLFFNSRKAAVRYVSGRLKSLKPNSVLTTTILLDKSGVFSAITVIEELSVDTEHPPSCFEQLTNIS